jgi:hypothetical protein
MEVNGQLHASADLQLREISHNAPDGRLNDVNITLFIFPDLDLFKIHVVLNTECTFVPHSSLKTWGGGQWICRHAFS